ncbi:DUF3015 family protein [Thalassotalea sp. ND16A]|uniref:DUF3015 family protein n=1 Tax=Thalassotalea sp. ND16A TaxID=1535422 RepID=UPI00051A174E|nr:DUF3015 family protein [Thalassotalea sp. ND16A]KGJ96690.1 hypothetical protein ND16A_1043 [Thalassotalea sp. ND16A]
MKKTLLSALMVSSLAASALTSTAAVSAEQKENLNPWTDCGIGAMIFTENGTAAAISNVIWDLGTTAVSSNVSSQNSCGSNKAKTAMFIKATMPKLEQEIATGEGEYVTAMLELRGCAVTSHQGIVKAVRQQQQDQSSDTAEEFYNNLEQVVESKFSGACASV